MGPDVTSRAERERHVAQMLANSRLEGFEPDEAHRQLLQEYIEGAVSLDDLLAYANKFAKVINAQEAEQETLCPTTNAQRHR